MSIAHSPEKEKLFKKGKKAILLWKIDEGILWRGGGRGRSDFLYIMCLLHQRNEVILRRYLFIMDTRRDRKNRKTPSTFPLTIDSRIVEERNRYWISICQHNIESRWDELALTVSQSVKYSIDNQMMKTKSKRETLCSLLHCTIYLSGWIQCKRSSSIKYSVRPHHTDKYRRGTYKKGKQKPLCTNMYKGTTGTDRHPARL